MSPENSPEENALEELREVAKRCAGFGFYSDYLQAVVWAAVRNLVPANPDYE